MLYIKIKNLEGLVKDFHWISGNDLFIKIIYGDVVKTTQVLWNATIAEWNEEFIFSELGDDIKIEICDKDSYSTDDILYSLIFKSILGKIKDYKISFLNISMGDIYYNYKKEIKNLKEKNLLLLDKLDKINEILR